MIKRCLFLFFLFFFYTLSYAQSPRYRSAVKWLLDGGITWQCADVKTRLGPAFSTGFEFSFIENETHFLSFSLRARYLHGWIFAKDKTAFQGSLTIPELNGTLGYPYPNYSGKPIFLNNLTSYNEWSLEGMLRANRLRAQHHIILYGYGSLGLNHFNAKTDQLDFLGYAYNYSHINYGNSILVDLDALRDKKYETILAKKTVFTPTIGIGLGYEIAKNIDLVAEYKLGFPFSDVFDGHALDVKKGNDKYNYLSLGFTFGLGNYTHTNPIVPEEHTYIPEPNPSVVITGPAKTSFTGDCNGALTAQTSNLLSAHDLILTQNGTRIPPTQYHLDLGTGKLQAQVHLLPGKNHFNIRVTRNNKAAEADITLECKQEDKYVTICTFIEGKKQTKQVTEAQAQEFLKLGASLGPCPEEQIMICQNGKTIQIPENQIQYYLSKGASLGPCAYISEMVTVCSQGKSFQVPKEQLSTYLNHGATLGSCVSLVPICINGKTMQVPEDQLRNYLLNGAKIGQCTDAEKLIWVCFHNKNTQIPESQLNLYIQNGAIQGLCPQQPKLVNICMDGVILQIPNNQLNVYLQNGATQGPCPERKVKICFNGKEQEIAESQLRNYLSQGAIQGPCPERKVKICFNGKEQEIAESQLQNYLNQGATQGPCPERKVKICFNGKEQEIAESQLQNYLSQGATQGPCPEKFVKICFNGKQQDVLESQLMSYIRRGATQGPCPERKVKICLKGKEQEVLETELQNYLDQGATQGPCPKKIKICHVMLASPQHGPARGFAQTIEIDESDWSAHEAHGDFKGECGDNPEITVCFNNQSTVIPVSELTNYIGQGAVAGPCPSSNQNKVPNRRQGQ